MNYYIEEIYNNEPFYRVNLIGDVGDGDYINAESDFTQEEFDSIAVNCLQYMSANLFIKRKFANRFMQLEDDDKEMFNMINNNFDIPQAEWGYPHTIIGVEIEYHDRCNRVYRVYL